MGMNTGSLATESTSNAIESQKYRKKRHGERKKRSQTADHLG